MDGLDYTIIFIYDIEGYEEAFIVGETEAEFFMEQVENKKEGEYYIIRDEEFLVEEVSHIEYFKIDFDKVREG